MAKTHIGITGGQEQSIRDAIIYALQSVENANKFLVINNDGTSITVKVLDAATVNTALGYTAASSNTKDFVAGEKVSTQSGSSISVNLSTATIWNCTYTGSVTIALPTAPSDCNRTITIMTKASSINWSGSIKWAGGTAPTTNTSGLVVHFMNFAGNIWYGVVGGAGYA